MNGDDTVGIFDPKLGFTVGIVEGFTGGCIEFVQNNTFADGVPLDAVKAGIPAGHHQHGITFAVMGYIETGQGTGRVPHIGFAGGAV